jgi:hypothetical protein
MTTRWALLLCAACGAAPARPAGPNLACDPLPGTTYGALTPEEHARVAEQLARTAGEETPVVVRRVLRDDLDGDGKEDMAVTAAAGSLEALLVASSSFPGRLRLLQFADDEPLDLLGAAALDPARRGSKQLLVRTRDSVELVRDTGEVLARAGCLTSP